MSLDKSPYSNNQIFQNTERILYPDILRIIAIFAVITIHVSGTQFHVSPITSYNWQITNFFECFVRWGVPVFVMVSGMFFLNPQKEITLKKLYHKNIFRLFVALISWGILYRSIHATKNIFTDNLDIQSAILVLLKEYSHILFGPVWYHLWFLYMIIGLYLLVPIFRVFTKNATDKQYRYAFLMYVLFGSILPLIKNFIILFDNHLKINFKIVELTGYAFYFVLGYYLSQKELPSKIKKWIYILAIGSVFFQIFGTFGISYHQGIAKELLYENYSPNVMIQAIAIFVFIKDFSSKTSPSAKIKSIIYTLSKYSFGIYLVHDLFNILFYKIGFTTICFNPIFAIPIRSIITFF